MASPTDYYTEVSDFRRKSAFAVAIAAVLILAPFSVNNFFQDRYMLGVGSLAIVIIVAFNALRISRGLYSSMYLLTTLVPAIVFFLALAIYQQGIIGAVWSYPAVLSFYIMLPERKAWVANIALLLTAVPVFWLVLDTSLAVRITATLLTVSVFSGIFIRIISTQQLKLHDQAIRDPMTGLYNRLLLHTLLEQAIQQYQRSGTPMTLVTIDIDHFKLINDTYGHDAGDMVLQDISVLVRKRVRSVDKVFRLGGEEFLILLFNTDYASGQKVAEELRQSIEAYQFSIDLSVTVSIGVATLNGDETWNAWMKRSDENLYRAKEDGRNKVVA